jgi:hypothetical protein
MGESPRGISAQDIKALEEIAAAPNLRRYKEVSMDRSARLQFHRLPAEAQVAALWRLALTGLTVEEISERTGWPVEQIRATVDSSMKSDWTYRGRDGGIDLGPIRNGRRCPA